MMMPLAAGAQELHKHDTLDASRVTSELSRHESFTQTGLTRIEGAKFRSGYAVFSAPDLIKTIQQLPGVASGTELMSGLYVHGGDGTDNLFLLDGVPLYQVSHVVGLFSSFNTDIVDNMEFYKSGFPARFGGKLSSVVDVHTRDGDFEKYHGSFSIGLTDGRINLSGPIFKGKTSFNIGLRRSWLDMVTIPAVAYINYQNNKPDSQYQDSDSKEKVRMHYSFDDFNVRLTHKFSEDSRLTFNFYHGNDGLNVGERDSGTHHYQYGDATGIRTEDKYELDDYGIKLRWGNRAWSLAWDRKFSDKLWLDLKAYRVSSFSDLSYSSESQEYTIGRQSEGWSTESFEANRSKVLDHSVMAGLDYYPWEGHHIRTGAQFQYHVFKPSREYSYKHIDGSEGMTVPEKRGETYSSRIDGQEAAVYAEDEMALGDRVKVNAGFRLPLFLVPEATEVRFEPRVSAKYQLTDVSSLRASYTEMNQFCHLVATTYFDLPTNCWMPSTASVKPSHSRQVAGGIYNEWPGGWTLTVEGYWKTMDHLLEYGGTNALFPPLSAWESDFYEGRGRSYGLELEGGRESEKWSFNVGYTLSKTERRFDDIYFTWYPDRNDNRHKLTVSGVWRPSEKFELYAGWTYRSGNRMTAVSHVVTTRHTAQDYYDYYSDQEINEYTYYSHDEIFESPNNLKLPDYHRLDLGLNFHRTTKRGNHVVWNVSLYNAYCRMNPLFGEVTRYGNDDHFTGLYYGIIPIIPTFSYTLNF